MADLDDDAPPPLSSLSEQVDALRLRGHGGESTSGQVAEESLRVANVVVMPAKTSGSAGAPQTSTGRASSTAAAAPALKKGFFDAAPKQRPKPAVKAAPEIPMIRAKQGLGGGPLIPDFLRVEPDEQEKRFAAMKADLIEKLKPNQDTVAQIAKDPAMMESFNDPEVMAAVNDIAATPGNMKKYKDNPKVMAFYAAMGKVMGEKLEKMGHAPPGMAGAPGRQPANATTHVRLH
ncbi:Hsc70-interacting protein [Tetrabaena socialis]|uniref:Hsc70-interacting protein n=1 Tax=Tetrabaena socialis TaxID=47790 RepID=A0A2J7ZZY2_9CHLO|nr:Hsc70-interacting protein [Tetrabaena socialis]|eukprot:PNH05798.1 Hsc70-interacting protein [Tetrabaena socialis]